GRERDRAGRVRTTRQGRRITDRGRTIHQLPRGARRGGQRRVGRPDHGRLVLAVVGRVGVVGVARGVGRRPGVVPGLGDSVGVRPVGALPAPRPPLVAYTTLCRAGRERDRAGRVRTTRQGRRITDRGRTIHQLPRGARRGGQRRVGRPDHDRLVLAVV